jgi:tetratricopeptide (TPR) repeat protein
VSYLDSGDFASAARCFEGALEVHRDFPEALLLQGWSYLLAARIPELAVSERGKLLRSAHGVFDASRKRYDSAESAASLATCLAEMQNHDPEAKKYYVMAIKHGFATPSVRNNLGYFLRKDKQLPEAIAELEEAIRQAPELSAAHENLLSAKWQLVNDLMKLAIAAGDEETASQLELDALDNLQVALQQIDAARDLAPPSAGLERAAARLFAQAYAVASTDASGETSFGESEMLEGVLSSCRAAIAFGLPPGNLQELSIVAPRLESVSAFGDILKSDPSPVSAVPTKWLVDVYPDIRTRLLPVER